MSAKDVNPGHHSHILMAKAMAMDHNTPCKIKELDSYPAFVLVGRDGIVILTFFESSVSASPWFDDQHAIDVTGENMIVCEKEARECEAQRV